MDPTLRTGDGLLAVPYDGRPIRKGDIVVFEHPQQKRFVVHRVSRVAGKCVWTRGDNSPAEDPWVLEPAQIMGRVLSVRRGSRNITVAGGPMGQLIGATMRVRHRIKHGLTALLRHLYRLFCRSRIACRSGVSARMRVARFHRLGGEELVLFLGRRWVGRLRPGEVTWQIRAPFRLFVDEALLPHPPRNGERNGRRGS